MKRKHKVLFVRIIVIILVVLFILPILQIGLLVK